MRLAVIGATGWLGGLVTREALERGHTVTAILRDSARGAALDAPVSTAVAKVTDTGALGAALEGHDGLFSGYRAPRENPEEMPEAARSVIEAARAAGVRRVVWPGGTGTLKVPGADTYIVDIPQFPEEWRAPNLAHREALELFRKEAGDLEWTYVSIPRTIESGERTGSYRVGGDELLVDEAGESRISAEDFAVAVLDLLEGDEDVCRRITVAY